MKESRRSFCRTLYQTAMIALAVSSGLAAAESPLPVEVRSAKTVYLVNETGNDKVLAVATDQLRSWARFAISQSKDDADLVIVFTHKKGMDKWSNVGITEMDVFVKGHGEPAFVAKDALKLITDPQHPTKACINDFRKHLEAKK
jgi:hypothetical protein